MAAKRDSSCIANSDRDEEPAYQPSTKRARNAGSGQRSKQQQHEPMTNTTYGQRCCFPGIEEDKVAYSDEDLEFEDESDALAYLKSVRQEASGIPHLLVAPKSGPQLPLPRRGPTTEELGYDDHDEETDNGPIDRSIYTDGYGDTRGYYQDGAYTAAPDYDPQTRTSESVDNNDNNNEALKITEAYFTSLRTHFLALRTRLHTSPPSRLVTALPKDHSPHVGPFGPSSGTFTIWTSRLHQTDPHPVQIAAMDKFATFRLLRVLLGGGKFLRSGFEISERTSRWVWALLARLPDRGELDHVEVGHVRELGKRAAVLMHSLRQMALLREEVELGGHDDEAGEGIWGGDNDDDDDDEEETNGTDPKRHQESLTAKTMTRTNNTHHNDNSPPTQHLPPFTDLPIAPTSPSNSKVTADSNKAKAEEQQKQEEMEDGEISDSDSSVPMDIEQENHEEEATQDMEAAKARLLANLDAARSESDQGNENENEHKLEQTSSKQEKQQKEASFDPARARMNMRATLNMILTVAGEFYGQRDLLEFRDPFRGI